MRFLKWVASLFAATVGVALAVGVGGFFSLFGGFLAVLSVAAGAVVLIAHALMEYFEKKDSP